MAENRKGAPRVRRVAQEAFGYDKLRPGQEIAIRAIVDGRDTLAVMPTGWGKSAIYQIAGVMTPGATVIVSPLIALQRDQVESLTDQEVGGAALVNSTIRQTARREAFEDFAEGDLEFLFLAPEQFNNQEVLDQIREAKPSLFVIDEAHCISEWGHDFRPDYLKLGAIIDELGHPTILALTATAAPPVREEIIEHLHMRNPRVIVQGFDRPNIWFGVERFHDDESKRRALIERVNATDKPGIIYAATRRNAEEVAAALRESGVNAAAYHAGMRPSDRERIQQEFMDDQLDVIVATTAFGMGIDKPNVRFVFHYDISDSIDSYYQEIGRAGRDGQPAQAILFYNPSDLGIRRFFAAGGQVDVDQLQRVATIIHEHGEPIDLVKLREQTELSDTKLAAALNRLEEIGVIDILSNNRVAPLDQPLDMNAIAEEATRAHERRRHFDRSRIEMIRNYAEVHDCRREYLLNYFGEEFDNPCGACDNCDAGVTVERDASNEPFAINSRVAHKEWGEGVVMRYEGDKIVVLFEEVSYKTLALDLVLERKLLEPIK